MRWLRFSLGTLLIALTIYGCWLGLRVYPEHRRKVETYNAIEAVFRHQFENNASGIQQGAETYFLSVAEDDVPTDFLQRFSGHDPPVENASAFAIGKGLKFYVLSWEWLSDDKVELLGGYYEAGLSSSVNRYTVIRKNRKWVVEKDELILIS